MKHSLLICGMISLALCGCGKKDAASESDPRPIVKRERVNVGDAYAVVLDKLGKPNINSVTENSRVLIYDRIEMKIVDGVVLEVHYYD